LKLEPLSVGVQVLDPPPGFAPKNAIARKITTKIFKTKYEELPSLFVLEKLVS
jgi:hypothetical protein